MQDRIYPDVGLAQLETYLGGVDLSPYRLDGPLPDLPETNSIKSRQSLLMELAGREGLTIRELARRGFALLPPTFPAGLDDFTTLVVPELRRRGLFRSDYAGSTLRGHLGLARPEHRRCAGQYFRASA